MKVLISEEEIEKRLEEIGKQISNDYKGKELTLVVTLKGAIIAASTLAKRITGDVTIEFIKVSSYEKKESTGELKIELDLDDDLTGKNLLIIEDIIDTGTTLYYLKSNYINRNAESVKIFALLDKPSRRIKDIEADYVGFTIENKFVVGYGLDYEEKLRELPYIGYIE